MNERRVDAFGNGKGGGGKRGKSTYGKACFHSSACRGPNRGNRSQRYTCACACACRSRIGQRRATTQTKRSIRPQYPKQWLHARSTWRFLVRGGACAQVRFISLACHVHVHEPTSLWHRGIFFKKPCSYLIYSAEIRTC